MTIPLLTVWELSASSGTRRKERQRSGLIPDAQGGTGAGEIAACSRRTKVYRICDW